MLRVKKKGTEWEKIFASHISKKRLVPRIYKISQNSTVEKNQMIQVEHGQRA